jgi:hypothetical protein
MRETLVPGDFSADLFPLPKGGTVANLEAVRAVYHWVIIAGEALGIAESALDRE